MPPPPDARRVDEDQRLPVELDGGVDRVARGARHLRHDHPIGAEDLVHERGFAGVRPPDDRDPRRPHLGLGELRQLLLGQVLRLDRCRRLGLVGRREALHDQVGQVTGIATVLGADRDRGVEAEGEEFDRIGLPSGVVALVDDEDHRRLCAAQAIGDLVVERREPGMRVDDEEDQIGLLDRHARLVLHALLDARPRLELEASRVDDGEGAAVPLRGAVDTVAGRAGDVGDDRGASADEPVEERALPDIWAPDDGHDRQRGHRTSLAALASPTIRG